MRTMADLPANEDPAFKEQVAGLKRVTASLNAAEAASRNYWNQDQVPDPRPGKFYVSAMDGGAVFPMAGPFVNDHASALADDLGQIDVDAHWELVDEMKSLMAANAANDSGDSGRRQEASMEVAEAMVSDSCSDGGNQEDVAMALWLRGDATTALRRKTHRCVMSANS